MRIGIIAPLEMRVPPIAYGGTELIVSLLTEELVERGNDVSLFASGDSLTKARLYSVCPHFLRGTDRDRHILNIMNVVSCLQRADSFDIIHNHTQIEGMAFARLVRTPMLTTMHGNLEGDWRLLFTHYRGWYNTISRSATSLLPEKDRFAGVIYNAINVSAYPFNSAPGRSYLLYLSRMSREKGPHLAIEVARKLKMPLVMAGNVDTVDESFFRQEVFPHVDGRRIKYVGEVDFEQKVRLLTEAWCLLAPVVWPEPFGLFMVEAMACGTPVVALNRGSVPEVVKHGTTGYVAKNLKEMIDFVGKIDRVDRWYCRRHVRENFDVPRMVDKYLAAYEGVIQEALAGSRV